MTLWNPLNVFSSGHASSSDEGPSASFDPSRIGDPLGPPSVGPIGFGDARVGTVGVGDPRRNPIGFAPPQTETPTRFRTEISFRRHNEVPRASALPAEADDHTSTAWQTPAPVYPDVAEHANVIDESLFDETAVAEKSTGFLRREISFRRKKPMHDDLVAVEPELDEEISAEADVERSTVVDDVDGMEHEPVELVAPVEDAEILAAQELAVDEPEADARGAVVEPVVAAAVPFYKREIGFRRKKAAVLAATSVVATAPVVEESPVPEAAPLELDEPEPVAEIAAVHHVDVEPVADELTFDAHAVEDEYVPVEITVAPAFSYDDSDELAETWVHAEVETHEPVESDVAAYDVAEATETTDADASLTDDIPSEDLPTDEAAGDDATDPVDVPADDTPSGGRFGTRKQKAPKQKKSGGAKGRKVVGLKIGASQIAAAVVTETDAGHELLGLARRSLAAGIVVDGEVRDEAALASAVRALFDEEKLPKTDVHIGLSSNRIGVRTLDIDGVEDESHFDNAVRFKAHEVLPVALSESVLDYRVLEERIGEEGQATRRVLLVVAPRDQVEPYQRVANQAGIKLTAIDLEALGLLRAFVEPGAGVPTPDDTATVVIAIGHESSTLLVSGGGACEFTRVFDWGGNALEEAIAGSLEVRPAEAATILRHLSLSGPGRQYETLDDETRAKATDAVRQRLTPFARELVNSLQFYQTQAESLGIGGILVTGGTSHLEGLDEALHQMIGVEVSIGDPLARIVRVAEIDPAIEATIGSLAVPIGLAIEDLPTRGINLLPKSSQSKKVASRSTLLSIGVPVAAAIPLAALSFLYLGAHSKVSTNQTQLDAVNAQIAALPPPKKPVIGSGVVGNEAARATAVAQVLGGRLAWDAVFRDLARVLPGNVWLSTLQLTQPTAASNLADGTTAAAGTPAPLPGQAAATPTAVSIDGFTYTQTDVARLLARLATLPSLERVTLTLSESQLVRTKPVVHFTIVADLSSTGGAS